MNPGYTCFGYNEPWLYQYWLQWTLVLPAIVTMALSLWLQYILKPSCHSKTSVKTPLIEKTRWVLKTVSDDSLIQIDIFVESFLEIFLYYF